MIDFTLSESQLAARKNAAAFASQLLRGAYESYTKLPNDGVSRFLSTKPLFETAVRAGIVKSLVPPHLGGTGGTLLESALVTEELFAVEPGVALNLLTDSLGLMPLVFSPADEALKRELVAPFLTGEGSPLAAFQWSEPTGTANFLEKGGRGIQTTARKDGESWVLNGEKIWAGNGAGWDGRGADVQTIFCRDVGITTDDPVDSAMLLAVPRAVLDENDTGAFRVLAYQETPGFTAHCGPHVAFKNLRVPEKYVVATADAAVQIVEMAFAATGAMVGAMGAGIMRTAFQAALKFAREKDQGGSVRVIERQSAADLLISLKTRIDTAQLLSWRAAHAIDTGARNAVELCSQAKIYGSEAAVEGVAEAMRVIGIASWSSEYPFARLVQEAAVLPIFDGGNQGVRRRVVQRAMMDPEYDPFAL
ncbi:acyl-CoA dehydrogenase [Colletotrichum karsti]|uniref:Acyl-CoA dehydrogenase n=1 Tax=Colletotrichum karsti TaxID=1095194 RepID=A0A9P6LH29_9PEZI|nr:acyl-CoA dehydrogenase [Colletotrichum karsti]KAF9873103.1 acyl-CoA dehydrogenase [Colletotrichum karsti]